MLSLQKTMLPFSNLKNKESAKSVMLFPLGISSFGGLVSNIAGPNASFFMEKICILRVFTGNHPNSRTVISRHLLCFAGYFRSYQMGYSIRIYTVAFT